MNQQAVPGSGPVPGATESTPSLFLRNATGLVRELTAFDAFNLVFSAVLVPIGFMDVMAFAPQFWPRANLFLSFLIAAPLLTCFGLVYLYFTVLMPRSGGDYVWVSRTLSPFLGFVVNVSLTYVFLTWVSFNFMLIMKVLAPALAYVAGIKASWLASPGNVEIAVMITLLTVVYALLMMRGVRPMARFMFVSFIIVWLGVLVMIVIMAFASHAGFIHNWNANSGTGLSYAGVVAKANGLGFSAAGGIGWGATLFAMVYAFNVYTGFQWTGYFAGEIKNVRRTAATSILGAMVASVVGYCLLALLVYKFFGFNFFGSLVYLGFGPGASHVTLPFAPYIPQLLKFLPVARGIQIALVLTFLLTIIWWTPAGFLLGTRNAFAWAFDRLAPEQLTRVSDRFHTPVVATIFIAVVIEILNLLNIFSNLGAWLLSIIWVLGAAFVIVSFAAAWMPWHKPELHAQAPGWSRRRFLGVPVITWVAIVSLASWAFVIWTAFSTGFGGSFSPKPMLESSAVPILAIVWYIGVRMYRRRQGVNLGRLFQEIPPE
jgi:amino acid transporter